MKKLIIVGANTEAFISCLIVKEKFPFCKITIIKDGDVDSIGLAEGTTRHWSNFCDYLAIPFSEFIKHSSATFKAGIVFNDWKRIGQTFAYSVYGDNLISGLNKLELYRRLHCLTDSGFKLSKYFEKVFIKNNYPIFDNKEFSSSFSQLHLDVNKLNGYLQELCEKRNIEIVECSIKDVLYDENHFVTELVTEPSIKNNKADFFIDCSGFKKILSSNFKFRSYSKYLPTNRILTFSTEHTGDNYDMYTTSTALSSGWMWKIPTQENNCNGYVFNDSYLTVDQATSELENKFNRNLQITNDIKFESGRLEKFWNNNVLSIGKSSNFLEPLESHSIGFSVLQSFGFVDCIEGWFNNQNFVSDLYNKKFIESFDNIVSFLQLHYNNKRTDSKFWKEMSFELTDFNGDTYSIFSSGDIDTFYFDDGLFQMFKALDFFQLYSGLEMLQGFDLQKTVKNNRTSYNDYWNRQVSEFFGARIPHYISHKQAIELIKQN